MFHRWRHSVFQNHSIFDPFFPLENSYQISSKWKHYFYNWLILETVNTKLPKISNKKIQEYSYEEIANPSTKPEARSYWLYGQIHRRSSQTIWRLLIYSPNFAVSNCLFVVACVLFFVVACVLFFVVACVSYFLLSLVCCFLLSLVCCFLLSLVCCFFVVAYVLFFCCRLCCFLLSLVCCFFVVACVLFFCCRLCVVFCCRLCVVFLLSLVCCFFC